MISRSVQIYKILFQDIEPVIRFGIRWGLILGFVLAVGGNLIVDQIIKSYNAFIQKSLIGINGSLQLKTTPSIWNSIESTVVQLDHKVIHSYIWQSQNPIKLQLKQGFMRDKFQIKVQVVGNNYMLNQLHDQSDCQVVTNDGVFAYGNNLFFLMLQGFDLSRPIEINSRILGKAGIRLNTSPQCRIETGIMVDYPILFLAWENLDIDPVNWQKYVFIQFNTNDRQDTEILFSALSYICKRIIKYRNEKDGNLVCEPINIFLSQEMKLADDISIQAGNISKMVQLITLVLFGLILFFSFTMLKAFKINIIRIVRMLGVNRSEIGLAFMFRGGRIGFLGTMFGIAAAFFAKFLIQQSHLIPFDDFFIDWNIQKLLVTALLLPIITAVLSGLIVYTSIRLER